MRSGKRQALSLPGPIPCPRWRAATFSAMKIKRPPTSCLQRSTVTPHWHLIIHKDLGDQLYDWTHDVDESNNVIHTAVGQQTARTLSTRLEDLLARSEE